MSHIPARAVPHAKARTHDEPAETTPSRLALLAIGGSAALATFGLIRLLRAA